MKPRWLEWARTLQAVAQTGIYFCEQRPDSMDTDGSPYHRIEKIVAEMIAAGSDEDVDCISEILTELSGIATPQAVLSGAIFRDGAILLVKRRERDTWVLPGSLAEYSDTLHQTLTSTIEEETGYRTEVMKLIALYDQQQPPFLHRYHLVFGCAIVGGTALSGDQIDGMAFFRERNLPALAVGTLTASRISRLFEHVRSPSLPTDFD